VPEDAPGTTPTFGEATGLGLPLGPLVGHIARLAGYMSRTMDAQELRLGNTIVATRRCGWW